ncbi:MAG: hypothetical protein A2Z35_04915 [Actinobacteria bacterium RBG_19FT_COMBO_36_27]|nr:MAG: hypothetical protein A2Z35_04915 [Actinobacteria bacterium RBG_19FT_COMBO_36_27]
MKSDILAIYGDVKLNQNICQQCGCRFFILDENTYSNYCDDCRLSMADRRLNSLPDNEFKEPQKTELIFHTPLYKRKYIPKKIRLAVYERDNYMCQYCGKDLYEDFLVSSGQLAVDHFVPYIGRGESEINNLFTACKRCNSSKYSKLFSSIEEVKEYLKSKGKIKNEEINNKTTKN